MKQDKKEKDRLYPSLELYSSIIFRPIITEKTTRLIATRQYGFLVDRRSDKKELKEAIEHIFGVIITKIRSLIVKKRKKVGNRNRMKGKKLHSSSRFTRMKKIYVTLAEGQMIKELTKQEN